MADNRYKADPTKRPLTPKQRAFADLVLSGERPAIAYRIAYRSRMSAHSITVEASRTQRAPHVAAYIAERKKKQAARAEANGEMSRDYLLARLRAIIEAERPTDRIRAIAQASRMLGYDAPQRFEGVAGGEPIVVKWMS